MMGLTGKTFVVTGAARGQGAAEAAALAREVSPHDSMSEIDAEGTPQAEWPRPWMPVFLDALASTANLSAAARRARVSRETPRIWRKRMPSFERATCDAIEVSIDLREQSAYQIATTGVPYETSPTSAAQAGTAVRTTLSR